MFKKDPKESHAYSQKAGQAATELAVFGAVLIFLLGTIVRTAVGNSYTQDYNFKAMRMAMLASWNDTKVSPGPQGEQSKVTAHNSASILFIEDRLSPDASKYGDIDRNPFLAQGSGTFSYNLLYPITANSTDTTAGLPVMDIYINGQHFPFTTSSYVVNRKITPPSSCPGSPQPVQNTSNAPLPPAQCLQNQCLRNQREWVGGFLKENAFNTPTVAPMTVTDPNCLSQPAGPAQRECQQQSNACTIFTNLAIAQVISQPSGVACDPNEQATIQASQPIQSSGQWAAFKNLYGSKFSGPNNKPYLNAILDILQSVGEHRYKLFYNMVFNGVLQNNGGSTPTDLFRLSPPICSSHPCKDAELSSDLSLTGYWGSVSNSSGNLMFDLQRNNNPGQMVPVNRRPYVAWQWSATAGTDAKTIGLDADNNQYPSYDIDGRLKEVLIYGISQDAVGNPIVTYEDPQGGDIDSSWDITSCAPKPGLQAISQIFTFTKDGTYLQVNEGKLYNPESGQIVRSANKRDTVDLVQRIIQLSNNTHRFCGVNNLVLPCVGATCPDGTTNCAITKMTCPAGAPLNPIEACAAETSASTSPCFTKDNFPLTCYDSTLNEIFVRSRLEDRRGHFWMTNASGQLQVK